MCELIIILFVGSAILSALAKVISWGTGLDAMEQRKRDKVQEEILKNLRRG